MMEGLGSGLTRVFFESVFLCQGIQTTVLEMSECKINISKIGARKWVGGGLVEEV